MKAIKIHMYHVLTWLDETILTMFGDITQGCHLFISPSEFLLFVSFYTYEWNWYAVGKYHEGLCIAIFLTNSWKISVTKWFFIAFCKHVRCRRHIYVQLRESTRHFGYRGIKWRPNDAKLRVILLQKKNYRKGTVVHPSHFENIKDKRRSQLLFMLYSFPAGDEWFVLTKKSVYTNT